jgi:hypothetical protein
MVKGNSVWRGAVWANRRYSRCTNLHSPTIGSVLKAAPPFLVHKLALVFQPPTSILVLLFSCQVQPHIESTSAMTSTSFPYQMPAIAANLPLGPTGSSPAPRTREHAMEYHAFIWNPRPDTPSIPSAAVDYDTTQALHRQGPATQEYPPTTLTFFDASSSPASPTPPASLLPCAPTPPAPILQRPSIREAPVIDAEEIRQIFPTELPPRPPCKRGFFAQVFKRERCTNDIELGRTPASHPLRRWGNSLSKRQMDNLLWWGLGWVLIIGLVLWITLTEIQKGDAKFEEDNGQW